jgi:hypothetical protein
MSLHATRLLGRRTLYIMGYDNRIQNGPHDCQGGGVYQSSGFEGEFDVLYENLGNLRFLSL